MPSLRVFPARVVVAAALVLSATAAWADTTLKWSLKPGETVKYVLVHTLNQKISSPGQELTKKIELTLDLAWKVNSVASDGTIDLTQTLERARAKVTAPGAVVNYDTQDKSLAKAAIPADLKAYELVVNQPYTIKLSPQGEIVEVVVPDSVLKGIAGLPQLAELADTGSLYSPAGVKAFLGQALPKLPKEPVSSGSSWNNESTLSAGAAKIVARTTYKITELAQIATFDVSLDTNVTIDPQAGFTLKITKQTSSGKVAFDVNAGRLESSTLQHSTEAAITDTVQNKPAEQSTETTFAIRLVK
jgi:Family of unknown function (DUF6263)